MLVRPYLGAATDLAPMHAVGGPFGVLAFLGVFIKGVDNL
eukprot:SAG31_NODE_27204_length_429_cov_20.445455_1_plen_39_part_01